MDRKATKAKNWKARVPGLSIGVASGRRRCMCTPRAKMKLTKFMPATGIFSAISCSKIRRFADLARKLSALGVFSSSPYFLASGEGAR